MNKAFFLGPVLFVAILAGSLYYLKAVPEEDNSIAGQINRELSPFLKEDRLSFQEIKKGMTIPLHSLIATFPLEKNAKPNPKEIFITLTFPRSNLAEKYLFVLFSGINAEVHNVEPFAHPGIETVLHPEYLTVTVHDGVMFHLQNGIPSNPTHEVFQSADIEGIVTKVQGTVYVSKDREVISKRLAHKWAFFSKESFGEPQLTNKNCKKSNREIHCTFDRLTLIPNYPPRRMD